MLATGRKRYPSRVGRAIFARRALRAVVGAIGRKLPDLGVKLTIFIDRWIMEPGVLHEAPECGNV